MAFTRADIPDQHGRVAIVTGANSGLGLETTTALAARGAHVVMAVRNVEKAHAAAEDIRTRLAEVSLEIVPLDLSSQTSLREAAEHIVATHPRIDLLVNNAGVMATAELRTEDGYELQFGVNHLGHWTLTALLMPSLLAAPSARVVTVTSLAHHMGRAVNPHNPHLRGRYDPWISYGQAKLANYHFGLGLQQEFEWAGAAAQSLIAHPGFTSTNLQNEAVRLGGGRAAARFGYFAERYGMTAPIGVLPQLRAATDRSASGGEFYGPRFVTTGPPVRLPVVRAGRDRAIRRLWHVSERETGVTLRLSR